MPILIDSPFSSSPPGYGQGTGNPISGLGQSRHRPGGPPGQPQRKPETFTSPQLDTRYSTPVYTVLDSNGRPHQVELLSEDGSRFRIKDGPLSGVVVSGGTEEFPDPAVIPGPHSRDEPPPPPPGLSLGQDVKGFGQSIAHGATYGWADDALRKMNPEAAERWEANRRAYKKDHPFYNFFGETLGAVGSTAAILSGVGTIPAGLAATGVVGARAAATGNRALQAIRGGTQAMQSATGIATRPMAQQMIKGGILASGAGGVYGAGDAPPGEKVRGATYGAGGGLVLGPLIPPTLGLGGKLLEKSKALVSGRLPMTGGPPGSLQRAIDRDFVTGSPSSRAAVDAAERVVSPMSSLLPVATGQTVARTPARVAASTRRGLLDSDVQTTVAHPIERESNRRITEQLRRTRPNDWKQTINRIREDPTLGFDEFGNSFRVGPENRHLFTMADEMSDEQLWLQTLDQFGNNINSEDMLALLTPALTSEAASAARSASPQTSALVKRAVDDSRKLTDRVWNTVDTWAQRMTGRGGQANRSASEVLSDLQAQRAATAGPSYEKLSQANVTADFIGDMRLILQNEVLGRRGNVSNSLDDTWEALVRSENAVRRELAESQGRRPPENILGTYDADGVFSVTPFAEIVASGQIGALRNAGQWDLVIRAINGAARDQGRKANTASLTGVNASAHQAASRELADVGRRATRMLDDVAEDAGYLETIRTYRHDSNVIRAFEEGIEDITMNISPDEMRRRLTQLAQMSGDDAAESYSEAFLRGTIDNSKTGPDSQLRPERVLSQARRYLEVLFPESEVNKLMEGLAEDAVRRDALHMIANVKLPAVGPETGRAATEAVKMGTYSAIPIIGQSQTQAALRTGAEAGRAVLDPSKAGQITAAMRLQQPIRQGGVNLAQQQRWDDLMNIRRHKFGQQITPQLSQIFPRTMAPSPSSPRTPPSGLASQTMPPVRASTMDPDYRFRLAPGSPRRPQSGFLTSPIRR